MSEEITSIDTVRASRDGHTFHERWAARRALQLVFPKDDLFAIAVEGLSTSETVKPGDEAEDIADLILYFGAGDKFETCRAFQTLQFKYKADPAPVTCSYLKKTIQKFSATLLGYSNDFSQSEIEAKLTFSFVTNTDFAPHLWDAIDCLKKGVIPKEADAKEQYSYLKKWCEEKKVKAERLFPLIEFQAATIGLQSQNLLLSKVLSDWTPGVDSQARARLHGLTELIRGKAGLSGQKNNLVKREDILDSLGCEPEDLFPANTEFLNIGTVIQRKEISEVKKLIEGDSSPVFIYAEGGVGKTVFIQSLAHNMEQEFETVIFDCFGGGSYRMEDHARHLPKIGLLQIVNELASRGHCDPQLPSDGDRYALIKAARKRLAQAATTVKAQSSKKGLLIIIDAADNAQREADDRKEDAFPRLLLASLSGEPVDGVKLVLTARPERMEPVIGRSEVKRFELKVFSGEETRNFLKNRRSELSDLEFSTAFARSGGNARVLDYLVSSWDENILNSVSREKITVTELIRQRCDKIRLDLHLAGWTNDEVIQFFVAISLLPPPIPLKEMAEALGWSQSKVNSAVADLAPMLELLKHGAIFRDEPTETFIRETYGEEKKAQQDIADRLEAHQATSAYAAEALPYFLVVINDSQRAYGLSKSNQYPAGMLTEHSRRRLKLSRLHAAFTLAVKERDFNLVLQLTMQLAQVAAANAKGDDFIRKSVGMSVSLGDQDTLRRLFQDRNGWRGERDSRLAIAFAFQGEMDEAEIHQNRAISWINWYYQNHDENERVDRSGPSIFDFVSIIFLCVIKENYQRIDDNLNNWSFRSALVVCDLVIDLVNQYEILCDKRILNGLTSFASNKNCKSLALQIALLSTNKCLSPKELKALARAASSNTKISKGAIIDRGYDYEDKQEWFFCHAALVALIYSSRQAASYILRTIKVERITKYDYGERYGSSKAWVPILKACIDAWAAGKKLCIYHLLPREVELNRAVKAITNSQDLSAYLNSLTEIHPNNRSNRKENTVRRKFSDRDCRNIVKGIELIIFLADSLQNAILARRKIVSHDFQIFLGHWKSTLRFDIHPSAEDPQDNLSRAIGLGLTKLFLTYSMSISRGDCGVLIGLLDQGRFSILDKIEVLSLMAKNKDLQILTGAFAQSIAASIQKDEYIDQRSSQYSRLAESLLPLSISEAKHYFREGLSQLDQMGGDDYNIIYSLLRYAAEQKGGWIKPELGHRLMNLCEVIFKDEPSKFSWALFGRAAAQSIGYQAMFKIMRWADQDVSSFSYGLPQLVCYLAKNGHLDERRAAFIILLCEEHGWYEWKISDGLKDVLDASDEMNHSDIFNSIFSKLKLENPLGGYEDLWGNLLEVLEKYPSLNKQSSVNALTQLKLKAKNQRAEQNKRQMSICNSHELGENTISLDDEFNKIVSECDLDFPHSIDLAIRTAREGHRFEFNTQDHVLTYIRDKCSPDRYVDFIHMLPELTELDIDDVIQLTKDCVELWKNSFAHIFSGKKEFISRIFKLRGSELFDLRFAKIPFEIKGLIEFCGDANFIMELVFDTLARERVELGGEEWIQLATSLCQYTSREANLAALEDFLSGAAGKLGDEIGEGVFRKDFLPVEQQNLMVAEIAWHLLGNADTFVRWRVARSIKNLVDLRLYEDLRTLLGYFDQTNLSPLNSENTDSSFFNSQQWLLMGLARACFYHNNSLGFLQSQLLNLASRDDIHATNKIHILRCLQHISDPSTSLQVISNLKERIYIPSKGYEQGNAWSLPGKSKIDFRFDYEFNKHKVPSLARLFGITDGEARDAIASEIHKKWPDAKSMSFFRGMESYGTAKQERYESHRDSLQRHALLNAATTLFQSHSVIKDDYQSDDANPWADWLLEYDVTFEDGTWLADHKDEAPEQAKKCLVAHSKNSETLEDDETLLRKIGVLLTDDNEPLPISGHWISMDGVHVRITSALIPKKGMLGTCKALSKKNHYDIWLPVFGSDGEPDRHIRECEFVPFIWRPERYPIGIDEGDEYATRYSIERAQLGKHLTQLLAIQANDTHQEWTMADGNVVLRNIAWGQWRPEPRDHRSWFQDDGHILFAHAPWLNSTLKKLNQGLVLHIDIQRYKSSRDYDEKPGLHAVYICSRNSDGTLRYWKAKAASTAIY